MKVVLTGAGGMLARALIHTLQARRHECVPLDRAALDVTDAAAVLSTITAERPAVVIQCAAYTAVDEAERDEARAFAVNAAGTANVAVACIDVGARLVYPSTDYVFDGSAAHPYPPDHATSPLNAYGRSKLAGEVAARAADALVVRTSWLYGKGGRNFVRTMLQRARNGQPLRVVDDQRGAPTATSDLAAMILLLLERGAAAGTYHATNAGETTWFGLASAALDAAGITADLIPVDSSAFVVAAARPRYSVLDCSATYALTGAARDWRAALVAEIEDGLE
ncbi:MAG: dTDP-4-dehydrorhamnose reductase [Gemmatimonadota bacterium]